jgi:hypothetical protein
MTKLGSYCTYHSPRVHSGHIGKTLRQMGTPLDHFAPLLGGEEKGDVQIVYPGKFCNGSCAVLSRSGTGGRRQRI